MLPLCSVIALMRTSMYCEIQGPLIEFAEYTMRSGCLEKEKQNIRSMYNGRSILLFASSMINLQQVEAVRICPEAARFSTSG